MKNYFLGVDIGNSKTLYALAEADGTVLQVLRGPGANYQEIGAQQMVDTLHTGIETITRRSRISPAQLASIYYGAAGADTPADFAVLEKAFPRSAPDIAFGFENDGWIALHSGTRGEPGMVVTCGTGNTNFAINGAGDRMRIGGLEENLGDVLGGPALARYAMTAAMRSEDRRDEPTILTRMIPQAFNIHSTAELINFDKNKNLVETVMKVLFAAAREGDGRALEICWMLVKEVLKIVREFHGALFRDAKRFTLVLEGSVFKQKYQPLTTMLELALRQGYAVDIVIPDHDPVVGALFLACKHSGRPLTDSIAERMIQTYKVTEIQT